MCKSDGCARVMQYAFHFSHLRMRLVVLLLLFFSLSTFSLESKCIFIYVYAICQSACANECKNRHVFGSDVISNIWSRCLSCCLVCLVVPLCEAGVRNGGRDIALCATDWQLWHQHNSIVLIWMRACVRVLPGNVISKLVVAHCSAIKCVRN